MKTGSIIGYKEGRNRAFFTLDQKVSANLAVPGNENRPVPVTVLSISGGEIGFLGTRCKLPPIHPGDHLTLTDICAPQPLGNIDRAEVAVQYVIDYNQRPRLSYSCEFVEIPSPQSNRIKEFVKKRLRKMGFDT